MFRSPVGSSATRGSRPKRAIRQEQRRKQREHAAAENERGSVWLGARRHPQELPLNEALAALKSGEREEVLLRFFEEMNFKEIGEALGLSEDTSQKRVSRSLDKMRTYLTRHGEALSLTALVGVLTTEAAQGVPSGCDTPILQIIPGLKITLVASSLFGSRAYQISQGTLRIMKAKVAVTTANVSVLVVAAVSMLIAGAGKTQGSIVGTWAGNVVPPAGQARPFDVTCRFNADGTCRERVLYKAYAGKYWLLNVGRYRLIGDTLIVRTSYTLVHNSTPGSDPNGTDQITHQYPAWSTVVATFSNGGMRLALSDKDHKDKTVTVLGRPVVPLQQRGLHRPAGTANFGTELSSPGSRPGVSRCRCPAG